MNRTEVHERDRDELHHQLKIQRVTWDALNDAKQFAEDIIGNHGSGR